jgi:XTP/dITP diphosphohydrolase
LKLLLVTTNSHKEAEVSGILRLVGCELGLECLEDVSAIECGATYYQNAYRKAFAGHAVQCARGHSEDVVFADDSGLELPELGGIPGIYSARFTYQDLRERTALTRLLVDRGIASTPARFVCCVVAFVPWRAQCVACSGSVDGVVSPHPRGSGGFGYDPLFIPDGYDVTFSEMEPTLKNTISHRARAMGELWSRVREHVGLGT